MPRELTAKGVNGLTRDDLTLLQTMKDGADSLVKSLDIPASEVNVGFHSVPSMKQLHLHVISRDFDSPARTFLISNLIQSRTKSTGTASLLRSFDLTKM
jgi:hypothetical protein